MQVTEGGGDVDVDVEVEACVFQEAEATLPFLGPMAQFHQVSDAVRRRQARRRMQNVLSAHF